MTNIETDLCDGVILIHLIERLTGTQTKAKYHAQPSHRLQKLDNMEVVINSMKAVGIQLVSASELKPFLASLIYVIIAPEIQPDSCLASSPSTPSAFQLCIQKGCLLMFT